MRCPEPHLTAADIALLRSEFRPLSDATPLSLTVRHYLNFYQLPDAEYDFSIGTLPDHDGGNLVCMHWSPSRPTACALVVHGYLDHTGLYPHLITHLLSRNLAVVCFDLPGHGLSSGKTAHIETFDHYSHALSAVIEFAQQHYALPLHGVGQSTGGALLLKALMESDSHTPDFASLNLLAPLHHPKHWRLLRFYYLLSHRFRHAIRRDFKPGCSDTQFTAFLEHVDPMQSKQISLGWIGAMREWINWFEQSSGSDYPVTIIQGDNDNTLDWRYNVDIFQRLLPAAHIKMISGGQHRLANEAEPLRSQIFSLMRF